MEKIIDCLLIGHNEMDFSEYEEAIAKMGHNSGAYRDLNLNFIRYNNKSYSISEIFNIFYYQDQGSFNPGKLLQVAESFSAAIAVIGSCLDKRGYTIDYANSFQYGKTELAKKLAKENILTIAITTTLYVSVLPIVEIVEFIRNHNSTAKIILGGPFISTRVRNLTPKELEFLFGSTIGADYYINSSQGEVQLAAIINALKNNLPIDNVNNIYYRTGNGFASTPVSTEFTHISENTVNWSLFEDSIDQYVNVRTAISCPFSCSFCGFPQHAGQYQTAAIEEIETQLKQLDKIETLKDIHFTDDTFNIPTRRFKNILKMMITNKFRFKWHSYFRCQFADREMLELMKESGCEGVFLGLESGNNRVLKNMNKSADTRKYLKGIELLKEYGIVTFGNFIIGFPGETEETVRDTIHFIETCGLDFFRAQLWYCESITPIWKKREVYNLKGESFEWSHATMDSQKACDLVEEVFLTVKNATWVPQYNFDFDTFWHLVHRGMSVEKAKGFLESFNLALKEKFKESYRKEVSYQVLEQVKNACSGSDNRESSFVGDLLAAGDSAADFEFL